MVAPIPIVEKEVGQWLDENLVFESDKMLIWVFGD
jgi:hypothetical protein